MAYTYQYPKADSTASVICYHRVTRRWWEFWKTELIMVLAVIRKNPPFQGQCALPGGFLNIGRETLPMCAARELREETGIADLVWNFKLFSVQSEPARDPRGHVIDHVYTVEVPREALWAARAGDDAVGLTTKVFERGERAPIWAFDHDDVVNAWLDTLKW